MTNDPYEYTKKRNAAGDLISVDEWQSELTAHLAKEVFGLIQKEEKEFGRAFADHVRFSLLASVVSTIVYQVISDKLTSPPRTQAAEAEAHERFVDVKEAIENCVASGFEGAVRTWSGGQEEFMCQIDIEPEAFNTEPC